MEYFIVRIHFLYNYCFLPQNFEFKWLRVDKRKGSKSENISKDVVLHNAGRSSVAASDGEGGDDSVREFETRQGHQCGGEKSRRRGNNRNSRPKRGEQHTSAESERWTTKKIVDSSRTR